MEHLFSSITLDKLDQLLDHGGIVHPGTVIDGTSRASRVKIGHCHAFNLQPRCGSGIHGSSKQNHSLVHVFHGINVLVRLFGNLDLNSGLQNHQASIHLLVGNDHRNQLQNSNNVWLSGN